MKFKLMDKTMRLKYAETYQWLAEFKELLYDFKKVRLYHNAEVNKWIFTSRSSSFVLDGPAKVFSTLELLSWYKEVKLENKKW